MAPKAGAKSKSSGISIKFKEKKKVSRKGVVAKTKTSKTKSSKLYKKPNVGQGR